MAGPIPKRSEQRRRRNKPEVPVTNSPGAISVEMPSPCSSWHPAAAAWYRSLAVSGQSRFYEPSDWAQAYVLAEVLSAALEASRMPALLISAWLGGAAELLTTEGARRRMRIELARVDAGRDADEEAAVAALDTYRARLSS